jgi:hypothetical protein
VEKNSVETYIYYILGEITVAGQCIITETIKIYEDKFVGLKIIQY